MKEYILVEDALKPQAETITDVQIVKAFVCKLYDKLGEDYLNWTLHDACVDLIKEMKNGR